MHVSMHVCTVHTMFLIVKINYKTFADLLTANFRPVSEICVTSFNISWDVSNNIRNMWRCIFNYELSISPPPIEGDAVATTNNVLQCYWIE